jgi:hypothetical protein
VKPGQPKEREGKDDRGRPIAHGFNSVIREKSLLVKEKWAIWLTPNASVCYRAYLRGGRAAVFGVRSSGLPGRRVDGCVFAHLAVVLGSERRGIRLGLICHCDFRNAKPLQPAG